MFQCNLHLHHCVLIIIIQLKYLTLGSTCVCDFPGPGNHCNNTTKQSFVFQWDQVIGRWQYSRMEEDLDCDHRSSKRKRTTGLSQFVQLRV